MPPLTELAAAALVLAVWAAWIPGPGTWLTRCLELPPRFVVPLGFAALATGAYLGFFLWYADPSAGRVFATAWLVGGVACTVAQRRELTGSALAPAAAAVALAALWLGILLAGGRPPEDRFLWTLPIDHQLPALFAAKLAAGHSPTPLIGDWLSSDRPPLAAALHLALAPLAPVAPASFSAQTIGTLAQLLWLPALWALAQMVGMDRRQQAFVLGAATTAGFFLLNTVYTWPKLFAAGWLLSGLALVLAPLPTGAPPALRHGRAVAVTTLWALGWLAHGAVAFTLLALPCWPAAWRFARRVGPVALLAGAVAVAALLAPWSAYRAFVDPPGNRLLKWHLAGSPALDERSSATAIAAAWRSRDAATFRTTLQANLHTILGRWQREPGEPAAAWIRRIQFFHTVPALGLVAFGALAWLRPHPARREVGGLALLAAVATGAWAVLMFAPGSTLLHQGSYATFALCFLIGAAGLGHLPAKLGWPVLGAHAALFAWAWIATTPAPAPPPAAGLWAVLAAGLPLAVVYAVARGSTRSTAARNAATE